jgi:hypothetical protein
MIYFICVNTYGTRHYCEEHRLEERFPGILCDSEANRRIKCVNLINQVKRKIQFK